MANSNGLTRKETKEWNDLKDQVQEVLILFGGLLFVPTIGVVVSIGYGIRAGLFTAVKKLLEIMENWSFGK